MYFLELRESHINFPIVGNQIKLQQQQQQLKYKGPTAGKQSVHEDPHMWSENNPTSSSTSSTSSSTSGSSFHSTSRPSSSSRYTNRQSSERRTSSSGSSQDSSETGGRSSGAGSAGADRPGSSSSASISEEEWRTRFNELQRRLRERDSKWNGLSKC